MADKPARKKMNFNQEAIEEANRKAGFTRGATAKPEPKVESPEARPNPGSRAKRTAKEDESVHKQQVSVRVSVKAAERFYEIADNAEPPWPKGYAFERAVAALDREVNGDSH